MDFKLIEQAKEGNARASQALFELHARGVYGTCARILKDKSLAEDAVQNTFLQAFTRLHDFDGRAPFAVWLRSIAINASIALLRPRQQSLAAEAVSDTVVDEAATLNVFAAASATELRTHVESALSQLTSMERVSFVLRHLEQQPLDTIAQQLDSNSNAVKQALFRGIKKLRAALSPHYQQSELQ
jgi:RNA polymerase sigma-70 factor, ECF subfamily